MSFYYHVEPGHAPYFAAYSHAWKRRRRESQHGAFRPALERPVDGPKVRTISD